MVRLLRRTLLDMTWAPRFLFLLLTPSGKSLPSFFGVEGLLQTTERGAGLLSNVGTVFAVFADVRQVHSSLLNCGTVSWKIKFQPDTVPTTPSPTVNITTRANRGPWRCGRKFVGEIDNFICLGCLTFGGKKLSISPTNFPPQRPTGPAICLW